MIEKAAGGTVITGSDIDLFRLLALRGRLKLEISGLRFRGRSTASILRHEFRFKGTRAQMLERLNEEINLRKAEGETEPEDGKSRASGE